MIEAFAVFTSVAATVLTIGSAILTVLEFVTARTARDYAVARSVAAIGFAELAVLMLGNGSLLASIGMWCAFGSLTVALVSLLNSHHAQVRHQVSRANEIRSCLERCPR